MTIDGALAQADKEFQRAIEHLKMEFSRLQLGRANPALVENLNVEVYGSVQPIKAVASINVPEPRSLAIQPWDRAALAAIERAISNAGLGLNPVNDGIVVRINIPPLTEERRADLSKHVHKLAEEAKISVRTARQDAHNAFKALKASNEITEDNLHGADKRLQEKVDKINEEIEKLSAAKEKDVMTV